ncbi:MAG TPA: lytic transglycosylase domain-containing protein [Armatimonadota bacterium]|nr:lytic transglycosylase domain-containing protein [Armatimonadota bacterium]
MKTRDSESIASEHQRLRTTDRICSFLSIHSHRLKRVVAPLALSIGLLGAGALGPSETTGSSPIAGAISSAIGSPAAAATKSKRDRLVSRGTVSMTTINRIILQASRRYKVDPALIRAIVRAESRFDNRTLSHAGAMGLMQLMPETARNLGVTNPWDPTQNIMAGTRFLRWLLDEFGSTRLAVAAYNAGPGAVRRHGGVPPYAETQKYVNKVLAYRARGG